MKQLVHTRTEHPAPKIINLVGPTVIVGLSATFYMSGYAFKDTIGAHFGVSPSVIEPALQAAMAEGFLTFIGGTEILVKNAISWKSLWMATGGVIIGVGLIIGIYLKYGKQRALHYGRIIQTLNTRIILSFVMVLAITLGAVSGSLFAESILRPIDAVISSGCHRCSVYRTSTGNYAGAEIFADKQRIVLAQAHGVRLIKVDDIVAIVRAP